MQAIDFIFVMNELEPLLKVCLQVPVAAEDIASFHAA